MSLISLPYSFTAGQTIYSAQVNLNFSTVYGAVNGQLDSTNISSARGIGANYIVASGSGATGVFTPGSYTISPPAAAATPFALKGLASQTGALQTWSSNTTVLASVDAAGNFSTTASVVTPAVNSLGSTLSLGVSGEAGAAVVSNLGITLPNGNYLVTGGGTAATGFVFGATSPGVYPFVANDGSGGGINLVYPVDTSSNGFRVQGYSVSGASYKTYLQVASTTTLINYTLQLGDTAVGTYDANSIIVNAAPGTGWIQLCGAANTPGVTNYIARANRDTYPYAYGIYNGNTHIYTTSVSLSFTAGSSTSVGVTIPAGGAFTNAGSYQVQLTQAVGGAATLQTFVYVYQTSGTAFTIFGYSTTFTGSLAILCFCIGY
jgi:hypothetical protein